MEGDTNRPQGIRDSAVAAKNQLRDPSLVADRIIAMWEEDPEFATITTLLINRLTLEFNRRYANRSYVSVSHYENDPMTDYLRGILVVYDVLESSGRTLPKVDSYDGVDAFMNFRTRAVRGIDDILGYPEHARSWLQEIGCDAELLELLVDGSEFELVGGADALGLYTAQTAFPATPRS